MAEFIFATGVENSYPMTRIKDSNGNLVSLRRDQMRETLHYEHWEKDFNLVQEIGLRYLRYGPPYYLTHTGPATHKFTLTEQETGAGRGFDMQERLDRLHNLNITPIIDLCHFGLPDWALGFQNREWPETFAGYAAAFARQFKDVFLYTPINEIYVTANFSGQLDFWNEGENSEKGFVTALCNLCRANILAMEAILKENPKAVFIQSESSEYFHPEAEVDVPAASFLNKKRFLSLDLSYGHPVDSDMYRHLLKHGMSQSDYDFCMRSRPHIRSACIMGNDYYVGNEHWVNGASRGKPNPLNYDESGEIFGYYVITKQYYDRYKLPVMHTETNMAATKDDPEAARNWFKKQWANVLRLKQDGIPVVGFTWYGLVDLVGWDALLLNGCMRPVNAGLFGLDRRIQDVGEQYRDFVKSWGPLLAEPTVEPVAMERLGLRATSGRQASGAEAKARATRTAEGFRALHQWVR